MSIQESSVDQRIRYGNIIIPPDSGYFGIPKAVSNFAVGLIMSAFAVWFLLSLIPPLSRFSMWIVLVMLLIGGVRIWRRLRKGSFGRYKWEEKKMKKLFLKAKKEGKTSYRPGPSGSVPDGSYRLPGLLAATENVEYIDSFHNPYGLLWDNDRKLGTVFLSVAAPGLQLLDQRFIDRMVAQWAAFMREAGTSANIVQVAATITTTRDTGTRLPLAVAKHRTYAGEAEVPVAAREVMDEVLELENQSLPRIEHVVSLTFSAGSIAEAGLASRSRDELADEISTVINSFVVTLRDAAAGTVRLMDSQAITDMFYSANNPGQSHSIDLARMSEAGTTIRWEESGPTFADAEKDWYSHSNYYTKCFQMWKPPATLFFEDSLRPLLSPDFSLEKKRVTLIYRPLPTDRSHAIALNTVNDALYESNQKGVKGGSVAASTVKKAKKTEEEMAYGATLVPFSMIITATTDDPGKFPRISSDIRRYGSTGVNLGIREATYTHDAAFALSMGAGLIPRDFKL